MGGAIIFKTAYGASALQNDAQEVNCKPARFILLFLTSLFQMDAFLEGFGLGPTPVYTVKDVTAQTFIEAYANHLKKRGKFQVPMWADLVKTGYVSFLARTVANRKLHFFNVEDVSIMVFGAPG